jgi:hypothetical protein
LAGLRMVPRGARLCGLDGTSRREHATRNCHLQSPTDLLAGGLFTATHDIRFDLQGKTSGQQKPTPWASHSLRTHFGIKVEHGLELQRAFQAAFAGARRLEIFLDVVQGRQLRAARTVEKEKKGAG